MKKQVTPWENVGIDNDFLFGRVMQDETICKQLLEKLLGVKISKIEYIETQKTIDLSNGSKGIRLDVYVEDGNRIFNIEMQTTNCKSLAKRARYYQGIIDLNSLEKGENYRQLKESYIIFICNFDPFNKGLSRYVFDYRCEATPDLILEDGAHKLFLNATAYNQELDTDCRAFLQYVCGKKVDNDFVRQIENEVNRVKVNKELGVEYMVLCMRDQDNLEEGKEIGIEIGKEIGIEEGKKIGIEEGIKRTIKVLRNLNISDTEIVQQLMKQCELTQEEANQYLLND